MVQAKIEIKLSPGEFGFLVAIAYPSDAGSCSRSVEPELNHTTKLKAIDE
jgi:hypothetical protein